MKALSAQDWATFRAVLAEVARRPAHELAAEIYQLPMEIELHDASLKISEASIHALFVVPCEIIAEHVAHPDPTFAITIRAPGDSFAIRLEGPRALDRLSPEERQRLTRWFGIGDPAADRRRAEMGGLSQTTELETAISDLLAYGHDFFRERADLRLQLVPVPVEVAQPFREPVLTST